MPLLTFVTLMRVATSDVNMTSNLALTFHRYQPKANANNVSDTPLYLNLYLLYSKLRKQFDLRIEVFILRVGQLSDTRN